MTTRIERALQRAGLEISDLIIADCESITQAVVDTFMEQAGEDKKQTYSISATIKIDRNQFGSVELTTAIGWSRKRKAENTITIDGSLPLFENKTQNEGEEEDE